MLGLPTGASIYVCARPIDLRKSFDGLCGIVEVVFQRSVFDGHLFLFLNQRRDRLKALWRDGDGLVIFYKRLEAGRFELPPDAHEQGHITRDDAALAMLLCSVCLENPGQTQRAPRILYDSKDRAQRFSPDDHRALRE